MTDITRRTGLGRNLTAAEVDANFDTKATTDEFTSTAAGLVPASGGGSTNVLRADGTWVAASGVSAYTELTDAASANLPGVNVLLATALGAKAPTSNPIFTGTVVGVTATHVGLGNVDNTSDAAKPVSTAQATAIALKANLAGPTFTGTVGGITASMVGLGSVNNTADASKPVSTAQQTALDLKANLASPTIVTPTLTSPTSTAPTHSGIVTTSGAVVTPGSVLGALSIDITKDLNTKSIVADSTFTFSGTPTTDTWFTLALKNTDTSAHVATIPSSIPEGSSLAITAVNVPASSTIYLTWRYNGATYQVFGAGVTPATLVKNVSAAYTTLVTDANTILSHPAADTSARTWIIDSNANVAHDIGTCITFDNEFGAGVLTISITSDTMELVGTAGSTGSRTLASGGQATAVKKTATKWRIGGVGLT